MGQCLLSTSISLPIHFLFLVEFSQDPFVGRKHIAHFSCTGHIFASYNTFAHLQKCLETRFFHSQIYSCVHHSWGSVCFYKRLMSLPGNTALLICSIATLRVKKANSSKKKIPHIKAAWWKMCKTVWTKVKGASCYQHGRISWGNEQGIKIPDT